MVTHIARVWMDIDNDKIRIMKKHKPSAVRPVEGQRAQSTCMPPPSLGLD